MSVVRLRRSARSRPDHWLTPFAPSPQLLFYVSPAAASLRPGRGTHTSVSSNPSHSICLREVQEPEDPAPLRPICADRVSDHAHGGTYIRGHGCRPYLPRHQCIRHLGRRPGTGVSSLMFISLPPLTSRRCDTAPEAIVGSKRFYTRDSSNFTDIGLPRATRIRHDGYDPGVRSQSPLF